MNSLVVTTGWTKSISCEQLKGHIRHILLELPTSAQAKNEISHKHSCLYFMNQ